MVQKHEYESTSQTILPESILLQGESGDFMEQAMPFLF